MYWVVLFGAGLEDGVCCVFFLLLFVYFVQLFFLGVKLACCKVVFVFCEVCCFGYERKAEKRKEKYRKSYKEKTILRIVEKKVNEKDKRVF